jgi:hypothetical protein
MNQKTITIAAILTVSILIAGVVSVTLPMTTAVYADKDSKKDRDDNKDGIDNNQADDGVTSEKIKDDAVGSSVRQVFGPMITIEAGETDSAGYCILCTNSILSTLITTTTSYLNKAVISLDGKQSYQVSVSPSDVIPCFITLRL